jgi:spermidine synthase
VPYHLTTREFNELVAAWLADDGVYVVNLIDGAQATFLRAYVATLRETFAHVYLAPTLATWRDVSHSTFVVVASAVPLDLNELAQVALPDATTLFVDGVMDSAEFTTFLNERPTTLLTDRFAPVEQMLAPAFRGDVAP